MFNDLTMPPILLRWKPVLPAFLMMGILAGCQTTNPGPAARNLPPAPSRLMSPVAKPVLYKGEDARAALRLTGSALDEANSRLVNSRDWYENLRKRYRQGR